MGIRLPGLVEPDDWFRYSDNEDYVSRSPTIERITKYLRISRTEAKIIKKLAQDSGAERALNYANKVMGGSGVEAIQDESIWTSHYWQNTGLLYVNMGDTYDTTLCYDTETEIMFIGSWGDWAEKKLRSAWDEREKW
jgi:hypothetical protein